MKFVASVDRKQNFMRQLCRERKGDLSGSAVSHLKVKLSLYLIKHHAMKMYRGVEV
jgi:hypothetical protein